MPVGLGQLVGPTAPALAWAGLAATAVPILIHLLTRLQRRPQAWGAMRFLVEVFRRHRTRLRIERLLLLAVRCLVLGLLGLALSGPALCGFGGGSGWAKSEKYVCLVIYDSLSTQALDVDGRKRFERLREVALSLVDALGQNDRVGVWTTAWSAGLDQTSGTPSLTLDHGSVRRQLQSMAPQYSRADLIGSLVLVKEALREQGVSPEHGWVVILSNWAADDLDLSRAPAAEVTALGQWCQLAATYPMPSVDNVQVAMATVNRLTILTEPDGSALLPVRLKLRRFVNDAAAATTRLSVVAMDGDGRQLRDQVQRQFNWAEGQTTAAFSVELAVAPDWPVGSERMPVTMAVQLAPSKSDSLGPDDRRWTVVELRKRICVGIVDRFQTDPGDQQALTPRQWLSMALSPVGTADDDVVAQRNLEAASMGPASLKNLDAALVLRPDLIEPTGWEALDTFSLRGGLVWLFMPTDRTPPVWAAALNERLGLDWHLGMEVVDHGPAGLSLATGASAPPVPDALHLLAADWPQLLRPVRVMHDADISLPAGSNSEQWLAVQGSRPLLVAAARGAGRVMLLSVALSTHWSNLPTKPLFVPLLHESLRSALGGPSRADGLEQLRCGDRPRLDAHWQGAQHLQIGSEQIPLVRIGDTLMPAVNLARPGLYLTSPAVGQMLAVNIEPDAGNTERLEESALESWFRSFSTWHWLDPDDPASVLSDQDQVWSLGWPLLWGVLALVLLEAVLARLFSHAQVSSRRVRRRWSPMTSGTGT